jgi:hypothetical protein
MKTADHNEGLYYLKHEHPHQYVRIAWIANIILDTILKNEPSLQLNLRACINRSLEIVGKIMEGDLYDPTQSFKAEFTKNFNSILQYLETIVEKMKTMPTLCYNLPPDRLP